MKLQFKFNRALSRGVLPPGDRRLWLGFRSIALRIQKQSIDLWVFEIFYRRLLLVVATAAVLLWITAASALFVWLNRVPHNQVGWFDIAAPWRWDGMRAKRGDTAVLAGLEDLRAKDYSGAFYNLRAGVARSPGNVKGRITLMQMQAAYDPARALMLMEQGLPHSADNIEFLSALFGLYAVQQIQGPALQTAEALLHGKYGALSDSARFLVQRTQTVLLMQMDRFDEAEKSLAACAPITPEEKETFETLRVELWLRAGKLEEARVVSEQRSPSATSMRQAVEIAVARGDSGALQSALRQLKANSPVVPGPYLLSFQSWHRLNRGTFRDEAEREYYRLFGRQDAALQAMAAMAVNLKLPEVLVRTQRMAAAARLSEFAFRVHHTELALREGNIEQAMRLLRNWEGSVDGLQPAQRFHPEFIKRLTRAAFAGTIDQTTQLVSHLTAHRPQTTVAVFDLAASVLMQAGNIAGANQVLQASHPLFPQSEPLLLARRHVDEKLEAAAALVASSARGGANAALQSPVPTTANNARTEISELLKGDQLIAARDLLRAIRAQKPSWLAGIESEIAAFEVELALLTLDQLSSRTVVRSYLDRYRKEDDVLRLVALVPTLVERNREADARMLYDELKASPTSVVRVQLALRALNLDDDLAALAAVKADALTALDKLIVGQEWAQAERMLKYVRDKAPSWIADQPQDLETREVEIRLGLQQRPMAFTVLRQLVVRQGESREAAFGLVRKFIEHGDVNSARLLAQEIVRLFPDDFGATRVLKEAQAAAAPDQP